MDRKIVYPAAIPQDTDILSPERYALEALARFTEAVLGNATVVEGLAVGPNSPLALNVVVQPGSIYAPIALDGTGFGSLAADSHVVMQQGLLRDALVLTITPPGTPGQSRVYLVQVALQVTDTDPSVLPYYNAANPTVAWSGPGNSGTPQNTRRTVTATVSLKAGTAATTGTQVAPSPDAGNIGLANVTVANGAANVTAGNIVALAPRRVPIVLPDIPRLLGAVVTTMTANTTFTADQAGLVLASSAAGNRVATLPLANSAGANVPVRFTFARTDTSGNSLSFALQGADTLNGLTANLTVPVGASVTLISDGVASWRLASSVGLTQVDVFNANGTATAPWWAQRVRAKVWGGGGGGAGGAGGGATPPYSGTGGGGGGYAEGVFPIVPGSGTAVTRGAGGASTTTGGTSSFGALCNATGGGAGNFNTTSTQSAVSGGIGSGGSINARGGNGAIGFADAVTPTQAYGGHGGDSPNGGGITSCSYSAPAAGNFPGGGGGGGGGTGNQPGGVGGAGLVIAEWIA